MGKPWQGKLEKIDNLRWRIPTSYKPGMKVPGIIYASENLLPSILKDNALEQVANVAFLPGIVRYSLAMPDIHWGYGFCIGGVAATDIEKGGVISPGGVGYDINCGVRLVRSDLGLEDVKPRLEKLVNALFNNIPCGVGSTGEICVSNKEEKEIFVKGASWAVKRGYGVEDDLEYTESRGAIEGADPSKVSERAYERGRKQSGTLGAGNHFLEVQVVDEIYDEEKAGLFGLFRGQVTIMIHTGSRGFGYQVCDDYVKSMVHTLNKYNINVPDRQLACAPVDSPEGHAYLAGMRCAANYAWTNRQCLMYLTRSVFEKIFSKSWADMGLHLVYDVAHNIAKIERHKIDGKERTLCVHRKGATRSFPPGHPDIPEKYSKAGQPVIIPGDMGTHSYVLAGTLTAMEETFGSTCHGAGRNLSRSAALKETRGRNIEQELFNKSGIIVRAKGRFTLGEEAPEAYKDIEQVVNVVHEAGISKKVARMRPLCVVKG